MIALLLVPLFAFLALAVDIGMLAVAKNQCQNAADAGALAGARTLDGSVNPNNPSNNQSKDVATTNATNIAGANYVLATSVSNSTNVPGTGNPYNNVTVKFGSFLYAPPTAGAGSSFYAAFPNSNGQFVDGNGNVVSGANYNLCQVVVTHNDKFGFAGIFAYFAGVDTSNLTVAATSIAAHRPRDVAMTLDFSGSMNNESDLWVTESYMNADGTNRTMNSNNPDTVFPNFGPYKNSTNYAAGGTDTAANFLSPNVGSTGSSLGGDINIGLCNISTTAAGAPAMVNNFFLNNKGSAASSAFTAQQASYADTPGGDNYLLKYANGSVTTSYATNVFDALPSNNQATLSQTHIQNWEGKTNTGAIVPEPTGYDWAGGKTAGNAANTFKGFTIGPNYWGKTFYIWPPNTGTYPSNTGYPSYMAGLPRDWRQRFFMDSNGNPLKDNSKLFRTASSAAPAGWRMTDNGNYYLDLNDPVSGGTVNYKINYKAILAWITDTANSNVNPFPSQLRSGNILFYSSIPSDITSGSNPYDWTQSNTSITDPDQRFWKEYIDFVIGVWKAPDGTINRPNMHAMSYGPEYQFGTLQITAPPATKPSYFPTTNPQIMPSMDYQDNPPRPRHRLWFGPMTMIQFMMDSGYMSGATYDSSMYPMKQGIANAINELSNNHPNDHVTLCPYCRPILSTDSAGNGFFNTSLFNLSNDYTSMQYAMWEPITTQGSSSSDARLWDSNGNMNPLIPRAHGDYDSNTASQYGLMLAYNQYSGNTTLQQYAGNGGYGRKGAGKIVIYESDGMYNIKAGVSSFVTGTPAPYNSYYPIRFNATTNAQIDTVSDGGGTANGDVLDVCQAIINKPDGTQLANQAPYNNPRTSVTYPGYSTPGAPAVIEPIAFGVVFQLAPSGSHAVLLQQVGQVGGTTFPIGAGASTDPANGWRWCIGDLATRKSKIQTAIRTIFDSIVPVSIVK
jgi:Flp pilus assembly protein TadG